MPHARLADRFRLPHALAVVLVCLTSRALPATAHEGHDHDHDEPATPRADFPPAIILPAIDGPKPWSDKPVLDDPDRFNIAIMTDNTGGHRPGVWMEGVKRVNLMRPEFVVSVGDLIEGYSEDVAEVEAQWREFLGFIDQLQMRFFFVAGNHDVTNPTMHKIWRKHFGREWYSFDYKGVHFVCLCSEDPEEHLGEEQLAWLAQDLDEHQDARWTLFFFHKPLWVTAEREIAAGNADPTNWKRVEKMIGDRPHNVFSGHVHHYVQYDRNGTKYYHLATTGGSSRLRGVPYGEFDHVTWLTMEDDGPRVAHLLLDGVLGPDVVTEESIARFRSFLAKSRVEVAPILVHEGDGFSQGRIDLRLVNGFDKSVELSGRIDGLPLRGLTVDPENLTVSAAPGKTGELSVGIQFESPIAFDHLAQTTLTARLRSLDEEPPLTAELTLPVIIDQRFDCPQAAESIVVDGALGEWSELPLTTGERPLVLGAAENWTGPKDASVQFATAHDDQMVYLAARVVDERVLPGDRFIVYLDGRPIDVRRREPQLDAGAGQFRVAAPGEGATSQVEEQAFGRRRRAPQGEPAAAAQRTGQGYDVELAIPRSRLNGADWTSFQLAIECVDVDNEGEEPSRVIWRQAPEPERRNTNFGQFVRQN